jgi:hypothetical protein
MNCKPGDLAIVVRAVFQENLGRLVYVLRANNTNENEDDEWIIDPLGRLRCDHGCRWTDQAPAGATFTCPDSVLRPLRDTDGADETLAWKKKETV